MTKSATRVAADKVTFTQTEVTSAIAAGDTAARAGRKNLIINGGFDVWQRGTSLTAASSYLADRWANGTGEAQSRQAFTVGQTEVDGNPTYYHRSGGGGSAYYGLDHKIENVGTLSGKEVTLSYWMKGSSAFTNAPYRGQNFGSGGSSGVEAALSTSSITTSWARYTHTFTFPSISGKTVGASSFSQLNVFRANIANIVVDIANVQLELGSVATDFEHRSYGEELQLCQRYYQVYGGTSYATIASGFQPNRTNAKFHLSYMQEMRAVPSIGTANSAELIVTDRTGFDQPLAGFGGHVAGKTSAYISVTMSAVGTQYAGILLAVKNGTTTTVNLDAEL